MNNLFTLVKKNILITGASSGIGRAVAQECSKLGANTIITGRNEERLEETFKSLMGSSHSFFCSDIMDIDKVKNEVAKIEKSLDGIVISAGINDKSLIKGITEEKIDKVMGTNFKFPLLMIKDLLKLKKINKGCSIVFISSISSTYATISNTLYACSKAAVESFVRVAALELASKKIRVNSIRPGVVDTPILESYLLSENLDEFIKDIPLGRMATPEDIAYSAIFLLSDASSWITGTTITIDGGITLR